MLRRHLQGASPLSLGLTGPLVATLLSPYGAAWSMWNGWADGQARLRRATTNAANPTPTNSNEAGSGTAETVETL